MNKLRLKGWLQLSGYRKEISEDQNVPENICNSLTLSENKEWDTLPWYEVGEAYLSLLVDNQTIKDFPILRDSTGNEKVPWDYPNREWYFWLNIFASSYGWKINYISELEVEDAIALLQEIEVTKQFEREWSYQLSEISYSYDPGTKKSKFVPMSRPKWMQKAVTITAKVRKIPKKFLPLGNVVKVNEDNNKKTDNI